MASVVIACLLVFFCAGQGLAFRFGGPPDFVQNLGFRVCRGSLNPNP